MTNKILGRGLSAFLDDNSSNHENAIVKINVDAIRQNPFQPRRDFSGDSLNSLAESIKRKGILQPILVVKLSDGSYQLVAGERRLRASKMAGIHEISAVVMEIGIQDQLEIAIIENIQRENLNPLEEAESYKRLIDEFDRTQEELSEILGKSRSHISNILRLLSLPSEIKEMIRDGKLTFGHARALVGIENSTSIANQIIDRSLSVRQAESLAKYSKNSKSNNKYIDPEITILAGKISSLIGMSSNIKLKGNGGIVEINFNNFEELDFFVRKLST